MSMASMSSMKVWMVDMSESDEQAKKALEDIYKSADEAMDEPNTPAKALLTLRWIKKLARRGLGESDD
jgi:hypothetical protein